MSANRRELDSLDAAEAALARALLHGARIRETSARILAVAAMARVDHALTLAELHERVGGDAVTAYRTLETLADRGVAHRVRSDARNCRYALNRPSAPPLHPHLVCDRCGRVRCVPGRIEADELLAQLRLPPGYTVRACNVILHGTCEACRS